MWEYLLNIIELLKNHTECFAFINIMAFSGLQNLWEEIRYLIGF